MNKRLKLLLLLGAILIVAALTVIYLLQPKVYRWEIVSSAGKRVRGTLDAATYEYCAKPSPLDITNTFTGVYREWFPNGNKSKERYWVNGEESGTVMSCFPDGLPEWMIPMQKGRPHGTMVDFYPNGQKHMEVTFTNGVKHGPVKIWHETGTIMVRCSWRSGQLHGRWRKWDDQENLLRDVEYGHGTIVKTNDLQNNSVENIGANRAESSR